MAMLEDVFLLNIASLLQEAGHMAELVKAYGRHNGVVYVKTKESDRWALNVAGGQIIAWHTGKQAVCLELADPNVLDHLLLLLEQESLLNPPFCEHVSNQGA